jgi:hypothetical protein
LTLTLAVPFFPELVAAIVALPSATPVTTPSELTLAMPGLSVDQSIDWSDITFPDWSLTIAARDCVPSTRTDVDAGATVTTVTTGVGGSSITPVLSELQTAKAGTKTIIPNWRAIRFECGDRLGMLAAPLSKWRFR